MEYQAKLGLNRVHAVLCRGLFHLSTCLGEERAERKEMIGVDLIPWKPLG